MTGSAPAHGPRLALVGDSLTHFAPWPELLPRYDTLNFGVSGNTTAQIADRLDPVVQSAPDRISLLAGTNDIGLAVAGPEQVVAALASMVETLQQAAPVLLHTIPPRQAPFAPDLLAINADLRALAASSGAVLVDLWPLFDDGDGVLRAELSTDGLHLNRDGYAAWAAALGTALDG